MCKREGDDANIAVRPPRGLPAMLREDHSDGRQPTATAAALCDLPGEDPATAPDTTLGDQQKLA
ncbi:jg4433, partial [Pararge aegeria aegeria]